MAGAEGAQTQDGLGAYHFHALFDQMAAGAFNDSRGDGKSFGKVRIVFEVGGIGEQGSSRGHPRVFAPE